MARYFPEIFEAKAIDPAKKIILTDEGAGADSDTRWALETPYVLELIRDALKPRSDFAVLDYGCGIGRLAKPLIESFGCTVIGVDASAGMRRLAEDYVCSDKFIALSPSQLEKMFEKGFLVDAAIAIWVFQHCFDPAVDIDRVRRSLKLGGDLFVLNMKKRAVPAVRDNMTPAEGFYWASDDVQVPRLLLNSFEGLSAGEPDKSRVPNMADAGAFWMTLRKRQI